MTVVGIVSPGAMGSAVGRALRDGGATGRGDRRRPQPAHRRAGRTGSSCCRRSTTSSPRRTSCSRSCRPARPPPWPPPIAAAAGRTGASPARRRPQRDRPGHGTIDRGRAGAGRARARRRIDLRRPAAPGGRDDRLPRPARARPRSPRSRHRVSRCASSGDEIGLASAVKMSTASVYKGRLALLAQALRAAHANGVLEHVLADLRRSDPALVDRASPACCSAARPSRAATSAR